ncbi:MAG: class I SAM-dependent methyltransferase, partial [Kiloniellales bacterium]
MSDLERGRGGALERFRFFLLWLQRPGRLGAAVPSGRSLAQAMAAEVDPGRAGLVVELGGGTGSVTAALLAAGVPANDLIVVEREAALAASLRRRFPNVAVIRGDARRLRALLARKGNRLMRGSGDAEATPSPDRSLIGGEAAVKAVVSSLPLLL